MQDASPCWLITPGLECPGGLKKLSQELLVTEGTLTDNDNSTAKARSEGDSQAVIKYKDKGREGTRRSRWLTLPRWRTSTPMMSQPRALSPRPGFPCSSEIDWPDIYSEACPHVLARPGS